MSRIIDLETLVRGGMRQFGDRSTLDMNDLAAELAVSRATLYRVAGSREALLGEVLWALTSRLFDQARAARTGTGVDGVLEVSQHFAGRMLASAPLREFLRREPEAASRVLFTPSAPVYRNVVAVQAAIFAECGLADDPYLAFLYVHTVGAALYYDLFTGRRPDLGVVERALRALLAPA
jgi:AcrR family transcriptional regulator